MSGLAMILKKKSYSISGSDTAENQSIGNLRKLGITIFKEQKESNISKIINNTPNKQLIIVISSAIKKCNEELKKAYKLNLKILHRSDILKFLIEKKYSISIAGSHGKTTTSTLITTLFYENNLDPTAIIGGIIPCYNNNAHAGKGEFIISEIDESDGSIQKYSNDIGLITNLELDHTDHYQDIESLMDSIKIFANNSKNLLANFDCPNLRKCLSSETIWWSTKIYKKIDYACIPIRINGIETISKYYEKGKFIDYIKIQIPGLHNLNNALAAIAACRIAGISLDKITNKLHKLETPKRRFEFKGIWKERQIIDDYAHHPSEVRETISMARLIVNQEKTILPIKSKRLVVVFQPHRYSRLRDLMNDFAKQLGKSDLLILAPIYSAGECKIKGINIEKLKSCILKNYPNLSILTSKTIHSIKEILKDNTKSNDLILIMGAGDITQLSEQLVNNNSSKSKYHAA